MPSFGAVQFALCQNGAYLLGPSSGKAQKSKSSLMEPSFVNERIFFRANLLGQFKASAYPLHVRLSSFYKI
jgi:hypothetical protein